MTDPISAQPKLSIAILLAMVVVFVLAATGVASWSIFVIAPVIAWRGVQCVRFLMKTHPPALRFSSG